MAPGREALPLRTISGAASGRTIRAAPLLGGKRGTLERRQEHSASGVPQPGESGSATGSLGHVDVPDSAGAYVVAGSPVRTGEALNPRTMR